MQISYVKCEAVRGAVGDFVQSRKDGGTFVLGSDAVMTATLTGGVEQRRGQSLTARADSFRDCPRTRIA